MANYQAVHAQERRIQELDKTVESIFDVRKRMGKGAYGIVWKATDRRTKNTVALKKVFDAFRDETDAQRTYREVIFLRAFRCHPNIVRLLDIFKASNNLDFYLVFEFMESDLHNVIKRGNVLKDVHKRFVMYQLINAIKFIHSGNVIHRDLKPSNILIDSKCRLKVADFGLARTLSSRRIYDDLEQDGMLTDYVATRWYRAPEILVASRNYTKGIDMWGLGCILGEMIRQKPLFQGTSTVNQIEKIVTSLPNVTKLDIASIGPSFGSVLLSRNIQRDRRYSLDEMMKNCCDDGISLVKALLVLNPHNRLTAKTAIRHPYVSRFQYASAEMDFHMDIVPPLKDHMRYDVDQYRNSLYELIDRETSGSARTVSNSTSSSNRDELAKPVRVTKQTRTISAKQSTTSPAERKKEPSSVEVTQSRRNIKLLGSAHKAKSTEINRTESAVTQAYIASTPAAAAPPAAASAATAPGAGRKSGEKSVHKCRHNNAAIQRELAAVAAAAAVVRRKKSTWQSQAKSQGKFHSEAKAHAQTTIQTHKDNMKDSPPRMMQKSQSPMDAKEPIPQHRYSNKLSQEKKSKEKHHSMLCITRNTFPSDAKHRQQMEILQREERRQMKRELELKDNQRRRIEAENDPLKETTEQESTTIKEIKRKVCEHTEKKADESLSKGQHNDSTTFGTCVRERIHHLELEMEKCTEELVDFVELNADVLNYANVSSHLKKLQRSKENNEKDEDDRRLLPEGICGPGSQNYKIFRQEQEKERQRQVQEFLARDETNEYDNLDLDHAYRAKYYTAYKEIGKELNPAPDSGGRDSGSEHSPGRDNDCKYADYFRKSTPPKQIWKDLERGNELNRGHDRIYELFWLEERREEEKYRRMLAQNDQEELPVHRLRPCRHRHHKPNQPNARFDNLRPTEDDIQEADSSPESN
ncbi:extracellular signal-regulated kinase 7 isoform X1 [Drosophila sechellia]|uniref:extracellular signal-regulated kinase 7 isoform X1 n=1 Tax=Drosophila sechellia TaxID=7238 RepID=UPI0013DDB398|nr:extracellular signal-regulated kinase 7 isoform X1 [Drosophila sechellia]XP_032581470.1 extracellular signal-regulated kinase 7 isoform X1 [Drosophila sechellia]XP_032581471.1 extracellular signal-regulated kinase 7 isoform X1 [Drosophila sechellia]